MSEFSSPPLDLPSFDVTLQNLSSDDNLVNFRGIETLIHDSDGMVSEISLLYQLVTCDNVLGNAQIDPELACSAQEIVRSLVPTTADPPQLIMESNE